jgi:hypothetical protein
MFQSIIERAEASVEQAVTGLVLKIAVAIPFLIALGFFTAATTIYVNRKFDAEVGYLIMMGAFLVVGTLAAAVVSNRSGASVSTTDNSREIPAASNNASSANDAPTKSDADREMLMATLAAVGPAAAPPLLRLLLRNLPLVAAVAAAGFVLTRSPNDANASRDEGHLEPAE